MFADILKAKGGYMNTITELLDLEDTDIFISDILVEGTRKVITLETLLSPHFCPSCGFRMYSRGIKQRTIYHPILQDGYELVLLLKQRRWRCTNPDCRYETNDEFRFVNRNRRTTNATDMLIILAFRDINETTASVAKKFKTSDTHVNDIFDRYVKLERLSLTEIISIDTFPSANLNFTVRSAAKHTSPHRRFPDCFCRNFSICLRISSRTFSSPCRSVDYLDHVCFRFY